MKVVFCSDLHVGNHRRMGGSFEAGINRRGLLTIEALVWAARRAVELEATALVLAGDIFDDDRPNPQLISSVQGALDIAVEGAVRVFLLVGNHDQTSDAPGHHALAPLVVAGAVDVIEKPRMLRLARGLELVVVPYRRTNAEVYIPEQVRALVALVDPGFPAAQRLLAFHAGVRDDQTAPWLKEAEDAIGASVLAGVMQETGVTAAFAGNFHDRRIWTRGSFLVEGEERREGLLGLAGEQEERLWQVHAQDRGGLRASVGVRDGKGSDSGRFADRPSLSESELRESGSLGSSHTERESSSRGWVQRDQCQEDALSAGSSVRREVISKSRRVSGVPTVLTGAESPPLVIVQCGSLCPTGFDDTTEDHGITIWDTETQSASFEAAPGPRFVVQLGALVRLASLDHDLRSTLQAATKDQQHYVIWKVAHDQVVEATNLLGDLATDDRLAGFEVEVVTEQVAKEQAAARAASVGTSIGEAVTEFVEDLDLGKFPGVDRAKVVTRSREYLGC